MDPILIDNLVIPLAGMITGIILGLPVIRAVIRAVERKSAGDVGEKLRAELEELRSRLEGMEELRDRLLELEERIDFAERMLARAKDQRLASGE